MTAAPDPPKFSVILPSFNGADTLPDCLAALDALTLPAAGAEFIFVDNRSTDETAALLEGAARSMSGVFLREPRPGKSHALNAAIAAARGEFLVFTDDDTLVDAGWLVAYENAVKTYPDVGVFAGRISPEWRSAVPHWVEDLARRGQIAGCTPSSHPEGLFAAYWVKGGNMMVRRSLVADQGFDTGSVNFGASSAAIGGEDSKLVKSLEAAGERIVYVPYATLRHIVQPGEAAPAFLLSRQLRIGRGNAVTEGGGLIQAGKAFAEIVAYALLAPALFLLRRRASSFHQLMKIARRLGMLQMWLSARR